MKKIPTPSRTERTALFRLSVIGDLLARELERGDLQKAFEELLPAAWREGLTDLQHADAGALVLRRERRTRQGPRAEVPRARDRPQAHRRPAEDPARHARDPPVGLHRAHPPGGHPQRRPRRGRRLEDDADPPLCPPRARPAAE